MTSSLLTMLQHFVSATKLHPVLVNFTAALVPVSVGSDVLARWSRKESLLHTAWWSLLYAVLITPCTAIAGWLFWMEDDNGVTGMTIHKWLGSSLVVLLIGLFLWRRQFETRRQYVSTAYLVVALLLVALLIVQGYLGGQQVFSGM